MLAWEGEMRCARRDLQKERRVPVCRGRLSLPIPSPPDWASAILSLNQYQEDW